MTAGNRFRSFGASRRGGVLALLLSVLATLVWIQLRGETGISPGVSQTPSPPNTGVQFHASISQPMIVQGSDGTVYLDLSVITPRSIPRHSKRVSTDTIVVLDRSGSMGEDNKWHYATEAVRSLLDRLGDDDRIAFVTFDSNARVESPLVRATSHSIQHLKHLVSRLAPGDSTNLGDALLVAERLAQNADTSERSRRVILLSDGHANAGIVNQEGLDAISRRIADQGTIVSTIGLGLGFNEVLMASLADQGMGHFSYLEHLESLASILSKELQDSRQVYAAVSEVRIELRRE